jgi:hypothetical protein
MERISCRILSISFLLIAGVAGVSAQKPAASPSPTPDAPVASPKVGGYRSISSANRDVRAAYAFAVKTQSATEKKRFAFVKVLKAESQVVAGTNYRICMLVREGKGRSKSVTTVVYRNLEGAWSLTQWVEGRCRDI